MGRASPSRASTYHGVDLTPHWLQEGVYTQMQSYAPMGWNPAIGAAGSPWTAGDPRMMPMMYGPPPMMRGPMAMQSAPGWAGTQGPALSAGVAPGAAKANIAPLRGAVNLPGGAMMAHVPDIRSGWHIPGWS
ncbi:MAG: hypothetical protein JWN15_4330, partial [Firmicutes bacterium]|nr:hypothetical protein [Bacillota bacterium]